MPKQHFDLLWIRGSHDVRITACTDISKPANGHIRLFVFATPNFVHHLTGGTRRIQPKDALPVITWLANLCFPLEWKGARTRSADFTALSNLLTSLELGVELLLEKQTSSTFKKSLRKDSVLFAFYRKTWFCANFRQIQVANYAITTQANKFKELITWQSKSDDARLGPRTWRPRT